MFVTQQSGVRAYQKFGHQASKEILARIAMLPASHRQQNLKAVLNVVDPSLYGRTMAITKRYQQSGMAPAQALQQGLARAMSTGLASEVVKLGQRGGKSVPKKGLMGLGAYGKFSALGAVTTSKASTIGTITGGLQTNLNAPAGPAEGQCDSTGSFIWHNGAWNRKTVSAACVGAPWSGGPTSSSGASGGVTVTDPTGNVQQSTGQVSAAPPANTLQMMQVGPFTVPLGAEMTIHWSGLLPDDWRAFIGEELTHDCQNCITTSMEPSTQGHPLGALRDFLGDKTPPQSNKDLVAIGPKVGSINMWANTVDPKLVYNWPDQPVAQCVRPDNGEKWGFYMNIVPRDLTKAWDSTTNPYVCVLGWRKCPTGVWDFIKSVVGTVVDWVGDALSAVGDLACQLMSSSAGKAGAVVAGAAIGTEAGGAQGAQLGAQAGAAGAVVAQAACGTSQMCPAGTAGNYPACIPIQVQTTPSWLMPVAIGGGALLLILAATGKKKKKASPPPP